MTVTRIAIAALFALNGAVLATWVPQVPMVAMRLELGEARLGVALLGMAVGALVAMPLAGRLIARVGSRTVLRVATTTMITALPLPLVAPDLPRLVLALALLGAGNGAMDVSMNAQAVALERRLGRPVMSSFHGLFSVGGLCGAAVAGLGLELGVTPRSYVIAAAIVFALVALGPLARLLPPDADAVGEGPRLARPAGGPVLALGALALLALVAEGAMADWSALYLHHSLGAGPGLAAAGFAACSLGMAIGRLSGDRLVARLGAVTLVRASASTATIALAAALVFADATIAVAGCAAVGLGLANVIPVVFGAAGRLPGLAPGHGLAAVTTAGYFGFLAGPPLIGVAAQATTLPLALGIVVVALAAIAVGAPAVERAAR